MTDTHRSSDVARLDAIEQYLAKLESMVSDGVAASAFFAELTQGLIKSCGCDSVGVWIFENHRTRYLAGSTAYDTALPERWLASANGTAHASVARRVSHEQAVDDSRCSRLIATSPLQSESALILDVWTNESSSGLAAREWREIVQGIADLAVSFSLRTRLDELSRRNDEQRAVNEILALSLRSSDLEELAAGVAKTLLRALERDRVSILQVTAAGARLLAVEPAARLNQHSSQLAILRQLATAVASDGGWLAYRVGDGVESTPRVKPLLNQYLESSLVREVWGVSTFLRQSDLRSNPKLPQGLILLEKFDLADDEKLNKEGLITPSSQDDRTISNESTLGFRESLLNLALDSLAGALSKRSGVWMRMADSWLSATQMRRIQAIGLAVVVLALLLFLIPAQLKFSVDGSLQPRTSRSIFATRDGVVEELFVRHTDRVTRSQPLLKIHNPDLALELQKLTSEAETLEAKLFSIRSSKVKQASDRSAETTIRLSTEEEDLKLQLLGIHKQLEIARADERALTLLSPLDGQVDGWDIEQSLIQRPIVHGEKLFQIFTPEDGWQLVLEIPDDVAGYVLEAQQAHPCPVAFRIRSDPSKLHRSTLSSISPTTQVNAHQKAVVFAKVEVTDGQIDVTRSGAIVAAQIDCGRSTVGMIWFRELLEFLQRSFWF